MESRIANEKEHGRKISENAEAVWNWDSPTGRKRAERRAQLLMEYGDIKSNDYCLEIGCGTALFTEKVYNAKKCKIVAIDISEDLLELARKKLKDVEFKLDDAMNLSFADNTFDVVYGSSVLHHLDMDRAYNEIFRVLKPGGRLVFAEPNMLNPQIAIQKNVPFIKRWLGDSPDETAIVRWKAAGDLKKVGFKEVNIFPYDFLHPIVPSPLIPLINGIGKVIERIPLLREIAGSVIMVAKK